MSVYTLIFFLELLHIIVMKHFPSVFKYSDSIFQFMIFMGGETQPKCKLCGVYFISIFHNLHLLLYINIMANFIKGDITMSSTKFVYATRKLGRTRDHLVYNLYVIIFCSPLHVCFYLHFYVTHFI